MNRSTCKSCKAPILWCETAGGGRMPLDPTPSASGNIVIDGSGKAHVDNLPGRAKYTSHFATCPNASKHRKSRK